MEPLPFTKYYSTVLVYYIIYISPNDLPEFPSAALNSNPTAAKQTQIKKSKREYSVRYNKIFSLIIVTNSLNK